MENIERLSKTLNALAEKFVSVNSGGCGIAALHLYFALRRVGQKPKLVVAGEFYHVMIELDGRLLDAHGIVGEEGNMSHMTTVITMRKSEPMKPLRLSRLLRIAKEQWIGWNLAWNHGRDKELKREIYSAVKLTFAQPENVD